MKIIIIGCGSIGRRHALNAKHLGSEVILCDINRESMEQFAKKEGFSICYTDYNDAIKKTHPDAVIIATPSNLHLQTAIDIASRGIHILMEKPLASLLERIDELEKSIEESGITFMMAQSYRFHEGFLALKDLIDQSMVGKIYHVEMAGGWYLPDWHIHQDYRKEYSAQKERGGGILLTSMSHTFDTIRWLFGEVTEIVGWKAKLSNLDIDVEDYVSCLLKTNKEILIHVVDDFISRFPRSEIRIFGNEGFISTSFRQNVLHLWRASEKRFLPEDIKLGGKSDNLIYILEDGVRYDPTPSVLNFKFENNNRYIMELKHFFHLVENGIKHFDLDFRAGKRVMELIFDPNIHSFSSKVSF